MSPRLRELYLRGRRRAGRVRRRLAGPRAGQWAEQQAGQPRAGRAPAVERRTTNLGPVVDDAVHQAERQMLVGVDPDHDLVRERFDALHYLLQRRHLMHADGVDLVDDFLQHGAAEQLNPQPHFSTANYVRQHPETAASEASPYLAWLKRGRAAGEHADPVPRPDLLAPLLCIEPDDLVERLVARRTDLQDRLRHGRLGEVIARATEIEPLIGAAWPAITRPVLMPLTSLDAVVSMSALHRSHEAADFRRARVVLVVNQARRAADLGMEGHLTHALARHVPPEDLVVIHTDASIERPFDRHPAGVRQIDFARYAADLPSVEDPEAEVGEEAAEQALVTLIRTFRADAVVNVRSRLLFRAMRTYTPALAASERLFLCLSGNTQTPMGTWAGWSTSSFYRTFDRLAGVITDNDHVDRALVETYRLTEEHRSRVHLLRVPVDASLELADVPPDEPDRRPQVFWAGAGGRQRRAELLPDLARRMPDVDFRVWLEGRSRALDEVGLPNLTVHRGPVRVRELPLGEADAWLYTAAWDAVPAQLLEIAMTGVPIVATRVGGTGEVVDAEDGWPVDEHEGPEGYERALRAVLADRAGARRRSRGLRDRMLRERDAEAFAAAAAGVLLSADAREERAPA